MRPLLVIVPLLVVTISALLLKFEQKELVAATIAVGGYWFTTIWDRWKAGVARGQSRRATFTALRASLEKIRSHLEEAQEISEADGTEQYLHLAFERTGWELLLASGHSADLEMALRDELVELFAAIDAINEYARIYNTHRESKPQLATEASAYYEGQVSEILEEVNSVLSKLPE